MKQSSFGVGVLLSISLLICLSFGIILPIDYCFAKNNYTEELLSKSELRVAGEVERISLAKNDIHIAITGAEIPEVVKEGEKIPVKLMVSISADINEGALFSGLISLKVQSKDNWTVTTSANHEMLINKAELIANGFIVNFEPWGKGQEGIYFLEKGEYQVVQISIQEIDCPVSSWQPDKPTKIRISLITSTNVLANPSFEADLENWNYTHNNALVKISPSIRCNGSKALEFTVQRDNQVSSMKISQFVNWSAVVLFEVDLQISRTGVGNGGISLWANNREIWFLDLYRTMTTAFRKYSTKAPVHIIGMSEFEIRINITKESGDFKLIMDHIQFYKQNHPVSIVIANDHWEKVCDESPPPAESVREASFHFEQYLGIKLLPWVTIPWDRIVNTTNLLFSRDKASVAVGKALGLQSGVWNEAHGTNSLNHNFDLFLAMTVQAGDHYGVVFGNPLPQNTVVMCGESKFAGSSPLMTSWIDNLIQHEISHIFHAPDRYTDQDPPSVMTKPQTTSQAIDDFLNNRLWLQLNSWTLEDLETMVDYSNLFDEVKSSTPTTNPFPESTTSEPSPTPGFAFWSLIFTFFVLISYNKRRRKRITT